MNKEFYVYIYKDPITKQPVYVGKGKNDRATKHLRIARTYEKEHRFYDKLREYILLDTSPIVEIHKKELTEEEAFDLEKELISLYGRENIDENGILTNVTSGGRVTPSTAGRKFPNRKSPSTKGKPGKKWSEEDKAKHKELMKAYMADPDVRRKVSEAKKGKPGTKLTEEQKHQKSIRMTGTKNPKGSLAKIGVLNPMYGKIYYNNGVKNSAFIPDQEPDGWIEGKIKRGKSDKKFYNDGSKQRMFIPGTEPIGWQSGRLKKK